jgi:glutamate formiminotransferase
VITLFGEPQPLLESVFEGAKVAVEKIDLNFHKGQHPRMGAVDVIPFVPIKEATMDDCVELAKKLGGRIGDELKIPVYLYEEAATKPFRKNLADIRKPQFEGLKEIIGKDENYIPDFGPNKIHPTAGAVAVGARMPLIAYNVDLETQDVKIAKKIAKKIREKDGGLPGVKALGIFIEDRNCAQVTVNLCNYKKTSLFTLFDAIKKEANNLGVDVSSSEIVGLLPADAIRKEWIEVLKIRGFSENQIIEKRLGL